MKPKQTENREAEVAQKTEMDTEDIMAEYKDDAALQERSDSNPIPSTSTTKIEVPLPSTSGFVGFTTAKGSRMPAMSKDAMLKAQALFEEQSEESLPSCSGNLVSNSESFAKPCTGFSTARGGSMVISKEALEKVKTIFDDEDVALVDKAFQKPNSFDFGGQLGQLNEVTQKSKSNERIGFSTANGTRIPVISKESLAKARALFDEEPVKESFDKASVISRVAISQESLEKAKALFESEEQPLKSVGFSTAKGSKVVISKEALDKVKNIFNDGDLAPQPHINIIDRNVTRPEKSLGFSTAKGSKVAISKEALDKVKNIFNDEDLALEKDQREKSSKLAGFSTAKGGKVAISKEALAKVKNIINEEDLPEKDHQFEKPKDHSSSSNKKRKSEEELKSQESKKACMKDLEEDHFKDDFEVDTQVLASVERAAFKSPDNNVAATPKSSRCKLIGIPKVDASVCKAREAERQKQMNLILSNKSKEIAKIQGSRILQKRASKAHARKRLKEFEINTHEKLAKQLSVHWSTLSMTSELAADYVFIGRQYFTEDQLVSSIKIDLGDGAQVVLNDACNIDFDALSSAFLSSPGVNPGRVSAEWVKNHYRWIVWKLASLERRFPIHFSGILHPHEVLQQLKYRYDLEIDGESRSALKKVYEKDDIPRKCLVLAVANICIQDPVIFIELTDGWYSVGSVFDDISMAKLVKNHQIQIGTKLVTFGAELVNLDQPCSPLEAPRPNDPEVVQQALNKEKSCPLLKLSLNSTRRARWDAKLGFNSSLNMPTSFDKLFANGGLASQLTLYIARKHPVVYSKETTKEQISQRMADAIMTSSKHEQDLEQIYHEVQREFEQREWTRQKSRRPLTRRSTNLMSTKEVGRLTYGKDIHEAIENSPDPSRIEAVLSPAQVEALQEFKRGQWEELHLAMKAEVEVRMKAKQKMSSNDKLVALMKLSVVDVASRKLGTLSIWRPNDDLAHGIKENTFVKVQNVSVGNIRDFVNLKSTKLSRFERINAPGDFDISEYKRKVDSIEAILEEGFSPLLREVDVFGVVINIDQQSRGFQPVHICDSMFNFVSIQFWGGIAKFCFESVIKPGTVLLFSNLQWRNSSSQGNFFQSENAKSLPTIPCLYVNEFTLVSLDSKDAERSKLIKDLSNEVQGSDFMTQAKERLNQLTTSKPKMLVSILNTFSLTCR